MYLLFRVETYTFVLYFRALNVKQKDYESTKVHIAFTCLHRRLRRCMGRHERMAKHNNAICIGKKTVLLTTARKDRQSVQYE